MEVSLDYSADVLFWALGYFVGFLSPVVLAGLFVWLFVRGCWMLDGVFPTATRATYCLGIFQPKLEREVLLAQPSETQKQGTHESPYHDCLPYAMANMDHW